MKNKAKQVCVNHWARECTTREVYLQ